MAETSTSVVIGVKKLPPGDAAAYREPPGGGVTGGVESA